MSSATISQLPSNLDQFLLSYGTLSTNVWAESYKSCTLTVEFDYSSSFYFASRKFDNRNYDQLKLTVDKQ